MEGLKGYRVSFTCTKLHVVEPVVGAVSMVVVVVVVVVVIDSARSAIAEIVPGRLGQVGVPGTVISMAADDQN
jgi:hypothetical protein